MSAPLSERERGQGLVEFALAVPVIVLVMLALFDAGRLIINFTELNNASRAGARVAMVNQSHDSTCSGADATYKCAAADVAVSMGIGPTDIPTAEFQDRDGNTVAPDADVCLQYGGCMATVTVDFTFTPITPIIGGIIGDIDLQAQTTMQIERTYAAPANP